MLDLFVVVNRLAAIAAWIVGGLLGAFVLFTGVTLGVALFSRNRARAERAQKILRELLALLRCVLTFRSRL